jgi:hypothetical protein
VWHARERIAPATIHTTSVPSNHGCARRFSSPEDAEERQQEQRDEREGGVDEWLHGRASKQRARPLGKRFSAA